MNPKRSIKVPLIAISVSWQATIKFNSTPISVFGGSTVTPPKTVYSVSTILNHTKSTRYSSRNTTRIRAVYQSYTNIYRRHSYSATLRNCVSPTLNPAIARCARLDVFRVRQQGGIVGGLPGIAQGKVSGFGDRGVPGWRVCKRSRGLL
jgi:hypothetical protein